MAVFDNRTGDGALDALGQIAADRISQGLTQNRSLRVVPSGTAFEVASEQAGLTWRRLADATGASLVVTGEYYLREGELLVQTHVVDARGGSMLSSPRPAVGPVGREMDLIEELRGRVMSALAAYSEPQLTDEDGFLATPPTWDAYQAYVEGVQAWKTGSFGHEHFVRAAELDPGFAKAALMAGWSGLAGPGRSPQVSDSLLLVAEGTRHQLSAGDQALLDWTLRYRDRDPVAALRAFRAVEEVNPSFPGLWEYLAAWTALWANHPEESLRRFEGVDADRSQIATLPGFWLHFAEAHHRLGNLSAAMEVLNLSAQYAARPISFSLDIPAALGDVSTVLAGLEDYLANRRELEIHRFPRLVAELRVHGHEDAVPELIAGTESLLDALPSGEEFAQWVRPLRAGVLYASDRLEEAQAMVLDLASDFPDDPSYLTYAGVLAARLDNRAEAERALARLRGGEWLNSQNFSSSQASSARIAAHLGNLPGAMAFLRQAKAGGEGIFLAGGPHAGPLLQPLWNYPEFQEFIRPEG